MINQKIDDNALYILTSGRYEFHNKGIDVFIDTLGQLNNTTTLTRQVVAVIAVPAHTTEPYWTLTDNNIQPDYNNPTPEQYTTHSLYNYDSDPIITYIKKNKLNNSPTDKVKIIFIPSYLNGDDGIINYNYFDFLTAFDITVFASYYEPWGYTPMESMALGVPTLTTSLAGYGSWLQNKITSNSASLF